MDVSEWVHHLIPLPPQCWRWAKPGQGNAHLGTAAIGLIVGCIYSPTWAVGAQLLPKQQLHCLLLLKPFVA